MPVDERDLKPENRPQAAEPEPARDRDLVLAVGPSTSAVPEAIAAAIGRQSSLPVLVADSLKAPEPALPIDVVIDPPVVWQAHSPMCRLLDGPARKRGWPFTCICGVQKP